MQSLYWLTVGISEDVNKTGEEDDSNNKRFFFLRNYILLKKNGSEKLYYFNFSESFCSADLCFILVPCI